jgi:hypothetical protein
LPAQDRILNVSLTAVNTLWNVADTLARSKGVMTSAATATASATDAGVVNAAAVVAVAADGELCARWLCTHVQLLVFPS